ncbi:MAG TPA: Crp/Fnr family transcriptional regulator [Candidatus Saccharimonadales bacterium]|nr:Crp/Fnr family transcriptional regulator [Candidatus Saccharimonadales bacterium]
MLAGVDQSKILIDLFLKGTQLTYKKGEFIIRPGEAPSGVFYIEEGLVKAYDITKYGEENLLIIRKKGDFLGLTWTITGDDRHIIYQTLAPTVVWLISRKTFTAYIRSHPESALPLIDIITDMYRMHSERILNLEYRTVRERLISFLLTTAQRFGEESPDGLVIKVPLRHQDIASSINSSRETTSREIAYLERKGLVKNEQLFFTLKRLPDLLHYLES